MILRRYDSLYAGRAHSGRRNAAVLCLSVCLSHHSVNAVALATADAARWLTQKQDLIAGNSRASYAKCFVLVFESARYMTLKSSVLSCFQ